MNVICILGGWLLLWEKSKRDCGEGEGGSAKKDGKISPRPTRIPAPSVFSPILTQMPRSPSFFFYYYFFNFPPIFPPSMPSCLSLRRTKAKGGWAVARRAHPSLSPPPLISPPSNSSLAPVPGALACAWGGGWGGGPRPLSLPFPAGACVLETVAEREKGASHHFRQPTRKMADALSPLSATRHRGHGGGPILPSAPRARHGGTGLSTSPSRPQMPKFFLFPPAMGLALRPPSATGITRALKCPDFILASVSALGMVPSPFYEGFIFCNYQ